MRRPVWTAIVLIVIAPAMLLMASCTKGTMQSQSENTPPAPAAAQGTTPGIQPESRQAAAVGTEAAFKNQNVNFDFASAALSQQARQILNAKTEYLLANPGVAFVVEGHCDERGTSAYNMALGERRAEMVKQYLAYQGIGADRMRTISYGEERPLAPGQNEDAWAQNRRAQFTVE